MRGAPLDVKKSISIDAWALPSVAVMYAASKRRRDVLTWKYSCSVGGAPKGMVPGAKLPREPMALKS